MIRSIKNLLKTIENYQKMLSFDPKKYREERDREIKKEAQKITPKLESLGMDPNKFVGNLGVNPIITDKLTKKPTKIICKCLGCGATAYKCPEEGCHGAPCDHGWFGTIQHKIGCGPVVNTHPDGSYDPPVKQDRKNKVENLHTSIGFNNKEFCRSEGMTYWKDLPYFKDFVDSQYDGGFNS